MFRQAGLWLLWRFPYVRELERRAFYDDLTGLLRRGRFFELLGDAMARRKRGWPQHLLVLYYIDLNRFKEVNDTHGHHVGDQYLRFVARSLSQFVSGSATCGRMGGDEFAVFDRVWSEHGHLPPRANAEALRRFLNDLVYNHAFGVRIPCRASVGYAVTDDNTAHDPDALVAQADKEMYAVKRRIRRARR